MTTTLKVPLKSTETPLHIECLGGPWDGEKKIIDAQKENIYLLFNGKRVKYADTGQLNRDNRIVYRCASGDGKLKIDFVERNP